jgi:23S rRNA (adenine1618-N6)-methyltransferase
MHREKRGHPTEKVELHPRNKHRERYNFNQLIASCPELAPFVSMNRYGDESIDFFNPEAVKILNKALLKHFYVIENWDIPQSYLCPPIPGRADYIHYIADLLGNGNNAEIPKGTMINCLDIGVGANCVYPIIGSSEYGWSFVGSDIDPVAIASAKAIADSNPSLKEKINLRLQTNRNEIFKGIILEGEKFDMTLCNPPFHTSLAESRLVASRKLSNLKQKKITNPTLNFGGQNNELWCEGGEEKFVGEMVFQSRQFAASCLWFSSLVSKESNLRGIYNALKRVGVIDVKTIPMGQGNKKSRIVAWTFITQAQQKEWINSRWRIR